MYAYNDLTTFEYEVRAVSGNGSYFYLNFLKLDFKISWNHIKLESIHIWRQTNWIQAELISLGVQF